MKHDPRLEVGAALYIMRIVPCCVGRGSILLLFSRGLLFGLRRWFCSCFGFGAHLLSQTIFERDMYRGCNTTTTLPQCSLLLPRLALAVQ